MAYSEIVNSKLPNQLIVWTLQKKNIKLIGRYVLI